MTMGTIDEKGEPVPCDCRANDTWEQQRLENQTRAKTGGPP